MSKRVTVRKIMKKHPLDAREMDEATDDILSTMNDRRAAAVREAITHVDDVIPKAGPYIATDMVMALGALLDEEMDDAV